jgi:type IV pilus assembly protein PilM
MARRLIGLDVGTNAVTVAEVANGNPPRLNVFGQVALPRDAMREGEVVDDAAVSEAIARLRTEVGLRKAPVRVGIASPRVIVRQVEMPVMSRDDLASALRFQAPDLIPIPIDEAAMDFAVLGTDEPEGGEPTMRVLLAAAQEATVARLVGAVEAGGLSVDAVDLVPLAMIRSLGRPVAVDGGGAEGLVSFGGGVTAIVVHEDGVPRFVRVLGTGGRELTDAIASEAELPPDTAESLKRQLATPGDHLLTRARTAIERPLGALLDDVRSSLDYYRNQPGAAPLARVVITGGGSQLPGLAERLTGVVGIPVELARPRDLLAVGDIGFAEEDLPRLDPYLSAAVGLALGGTGTGTVINLLPRARRRRVTTVTATRQRTMIGAGVAAAALVVVLLVPTLARQNQLNDAKNNTKDQEARNAQLQSDINKLADAREQQQTLERTRAQVETVLANDVGWARMLQELSRTIPQDVWLTGFDGAVASPTTGTGGTPTTPTTSATTTTSSGATTTTAAGSTPTTARPTTPGVVGGGPSGTITFTGNGLDYSSVSAWLERLSKMESITRLFVPNAALVQSATRDVVQFTSTAVITPGARSDRLTQFEGTGQ